MSVQEKYALTDEGMRNVKLGAVWTAAANLVVFGGVGALYLLMSELVAHLTEGAPLPDLLPYAAGLVAFAVALFVAEYWAYYYQYGVIYKESGRQRIGLAEPPAQAAPGLLRPPATWPTSPETLHDRRQDHRARL
mgnify:CR=1 FL=1